MARKATKDRWKMKKWYSIYAPELFNSVKIGTTPATEEEHILGRILEINRGDLGGDMHDIKKQRQKLSFKVVSVKGTEAQTKLIKVEVTRDFERSLVRRGNAKIEAIQTANTRDGRKVRLKVLALSNRKPQTTKEKLIRKLFADAIKGSAEKKDYAQFMQEVLYGGMASQMYKSSSKIYPMRHVTISKCKLIE